MKSRLLSLFILGCILCANAADITVWRVRVTSAATNGDQIVCTTLGTIDQRNWVTAVSTASREVAVTNSIGAAATNLYQHLANYPFAGLTASLSGTNTVLLTTQPGLVTPIGVSAGWCSVDFYQQPQGEIQDVTRKTIRYRNNSQLQFDSTSSLRDEDNAWSFGKGTLVNGHLSMTGSDTAYSIFTDASGNSITFRNDGTNDGWSFNSGSVYGSVFYASDRFEGDVVGSISGGNVSGNGAGLTNVTVTIAVTATNAVNATNLWGVLSMTNMPSGLSLITNSVVSGVVTNGDGSITVSTTNLVYLGLRP
jgi:hypothetical protein